MRVNTLHAAGRIYPTSFNFTAFTWHFLDIECQIQSIFVKLLLKNFFGKIKKIRGDFHPVFHILLRKNRSGPHVRPALLLFYASVLHIGIHVAIEFIGHFFRRLLGQKRNDDDRNQREDESGQKFVDRENSAELLDEEIPHDNGDSTR